jgi:hypothetical protein
VKRCKDKTTELWLVRWWPRMELIAVLSMARRGVSHVQWDGTRVSGVCDNGGLAGQSQLLFRWDIPAARVLPDGAGAGGWAAVGQDAAAATGAWARMKSAVKSVFAYVVKGSGSIVPANHLHQRLAAASKLAIDAMTVGPGGGGGGGGSSGGGSSGGAAAGRPRLMHASLWPVDMPPSAKGRGLRDHPVLCISQFLAAFGSHVRHQHERCSNASARALAVVHHVWRARVCVQSGRLLVLDTVARAELYRVEGMLAAVLRVAPSIAC